jgi:hypothetical protein
VFLLFIGGEIPAMAGIRALVIPLAKRFVPQAGLTLYVAEVAFAFVLIFGVGCVLGWVSVTFNKESAPAKTRFGKWLERRKLDKGSVVGRLLEYGEPLGFVLASYLGGAALVGWWYARKADPYALRKAVIAAAVLGLFSSALWVTVFNPAYTWVGITVAISMPVLAIPATLLVRAGRQGSHVMR